MRFTLLLLLFTSAYSQEIISEDYLKLDSSKKTSQIERCELFVKFLEQLQIKLKKDLEKSKRGFEVKDVKELLSADPKLKKLLLLYSQGKLTAKLVNNFEKQATTKISKAGLPKEQKQALEQWDSSSATSRKKILILRGFERGRLTFLETTLTDLGYDVKVKNYGVKSTGSFREYDQIWLISGARSGVKDADIRRDIRKFKNYVASGNGLYVLADNDPFFHHANMLSQELHKAEIVGSYEGRQMIDIYGYNDQINLEYEDKEKKTFDHELLTGIYSLYEGVTISNISESEQLNIVLRASDGKALVCTSKKEKELIVYDCGFTRLFDKWMVDPYNTRLWIRNVATYLNGHKRKDLKSLNRYSK
jgi:hypothetical protein